MNDCCGVCKTLRTTEPGERSGHRFCSSQDLFLQVEDVWYPVFTGMTVGRGVGNTVRVRRDFKVSRHVFRIESTPAGWALEDVGSACGTLIQGRLIQRELLEEGDEIYLGDTLIHLATELPC